MKRRPVIGITTFARNSNNQFCLTATYVDSVRAAGGLPILLPPGEIEPAEVLSLVDGIIFSGGGDIDISFYGGETHPAIYQVDPERDRFEMALAQQLLDETLPVLGICRGHQLLAVASGGTLIPHLPDEVGEAVPHTHAEQPMSPHPVEIEAGSHLAAIMGLTQVEVPSSHHQAARTVPPGWQVAARAPDGIIEALERVNHPWMIAVQWHPERAPEAAPHQALFRALVEAAGKRNG